MDILQDNDFMAIFIDMFRELPCLWEINHPHYRNQTKRKAALDQLLEIVKQVIPTADITYLKILIGGLRSIYGSLNQEVAGPSRLPDMLVPPQHLERESGRRRSALEEAAIGLFWKATEALGAPHTVEEDFAAIIASKMQRMEEGQQL
ncbi:hypothetical protein AB205_0207320, partial [Aquarana catesbeiana]